MSSTELKVRVEKICALAAAAGISLTPSGAAFVLGYVANRMYVLCIVFRTAVCHLCVHSQALPTKVGRPPAGLARSFVWNRGG